MGIADHVVKCSTHLLSAAMGIAGHVVKCPTHPLLASCEGPQLMSTFVMSLEECYFGSGSITTYTSCKSLYEGDIRSRTLNIWQGSIGQ